MCLSLSIIIPVFNNWKFTKSTLSFFQKHNANFFEIIVVDNGSTDNTQEEIKQFTHLDNFIYLRNNKNLGFGKAINQAFKVSRGEKVLFLNNDIIFAVNNLDWLQILLKFVDDNVLLGPTGGLLDHNFNFVYETTDKNKKINYMSGWFLCANKKLLSCLSKGYNGPFDDKTFFVYFEDADLSFRASQAGAKFVLYSVPIFHIGKQTSNKMGLTQLYLESQNKFIQKWKGKH